MKTGASRRRPSSRYGPDQERKAPLRVRKPLPHRDECVAATIGDDPLKAIRHACAKTSAPSSWSRCSFKRNPDAGRDSSDASVALRTVRGSRRRSSPSSSMRSNAYMKASPSCRRYRMRSNRAIPCSSQTTASPSIMQDRQRSRARLLR